MFGPGRRMARRTARRTSRRVVRRQMAFNEPEPAYDEPEPQYQQPAAPAEPDYAAELEKLAQLKAQGVITEADFDAKKKQILGI